MIENLESQKRNSEQRKNMGIQEKYILSASLNSLIPVILGICNQSLTTVVKFLDNIY